MSRRPTIDEDGLHREVQARLAEAGQRYTSRRRALVELMAAADRPLSLPELLAEGGELAQSSAYRNLSVLVDAAVVRRLVHGADHARYELAEEFTAHHHHLICESCGTVTDIEFGEKLEASLEQAFTRAAREHAFTPRGHAVDLYGRCVACA
jgi:Fur family ferric uptake transcriptional regulator